MLLEEYIVFNLFKKPVPKPTLMQRAMMVKGWLTSAMAIVASLVYFYGFVQPNLDDFKNSQVEAITIGGAVYVSIKSNKVPDVPVTVSFTVDGVDIAHRHYSLGIPSIKGHHFAEGQGEWIEPIPLLFRIQNPSLTVRFSFQGIKTLMVPEVVTFTTNIVDGNEAPETNKELFKGEINAFGNMVAYN